MSVTGTKQNILQDKRISCAIRYKRNAISRKNSLIFINATRMILKQLNNRSSLRKVEMQKN